MAEASLYVAKPKAVLFDNTVCTAEDIKEQAFAVETAALDTLVPFRRGESSVSHGYTVFMTSKGFSGETYLFL